MLSVRMSKRGQWCEGFPLWTSSAAAYRSAPAHRLVIAAVHRWMHHCFLQLHTKLLLEVFLRHPLWRAVPLWDNKKLSGTTKPLNSWLQRISTKQDFTLSLKTHGNIISMFFFLCIYKIRRNSDVCGRTLVYLVHSTGGLKKSNNTPGICVLSSGILSSIPWLWPKLIKDATGKRMELQVIIYK